MSLQLKQRGVSIRICCLRTFHSFDLYLLSNACGDLPREVSCGKLETHGLSCDFHLNDGTVQRSDLLHYLLHHLNNVGRRFQLLKTEHNSGLLETCRSVPVTLGGLEDPSVQNDRRVCLSLRGCEVRTLIDTGQAF